MTRVNWDQKSCLCYPVFCIVSVCVIQYFVQLVFVLSILHCVVYCLKVTTSFDKDAVSDLQKNKVHVFLICFFLSMLK